jgi:hypothetical protein
MKNTYSEKEIYNIRKFVSSKYLSILKVVLLVIVILSISGTAYHFYVFYKFYNASGYSYSELNALVSKPKLKKNISPIDLYLTKYYWKSPSEIGELLFMIVLYLVFVRIVKDSNTIVKLDDKLKSIENKKA